VDFLRGLKRAAFGGGASCCLWRGGEAPFSHSVYTNESKGVLEEAKREEEDDQKIRRCLGLDLKRRQEAIGVRKRSKQEKGANQSRGGMKPNNRVEEAKGRKEEGGGYQTSRGKTQKEGGI